MDDDGGQRESDATRGLPFPKFNAIDGFFGSSNSSQAPPHSSGSPRHSACIYIRVRTSDTVYLSVQRTIFEMDFEKGVCTTSSIEQRKGHIL